MPTVRRRTPISASPTPRPAAKLPDRQRAKAELNVVLAFAGSTQLTKHADVRVVGRQVRAKAHTVLHRDRGKRCTVEREVTEGAYSRLPVWSHRDQWLSLVQMAANVWFPEQIHRQVRVATLLKFAALVAAEADDATGRNCRRVYPELARDMGVSVETVRKCWRALERLGLAVQVERSVVFSYNERMRIWRLERSKQRGHTPEYALVVPAAYARALVTGEHPSDLLAQETDETAAGAELVTPVQRLAAALRHLSSTEPVPQAPARPPRPAVPGHETGGQGRSADAPVDNFCGLSFRKLENVDILGLPRSGPRCSFAAASLLVGVVPHGVKSTASRAHNQADRSGGEPGGSESRGRTQRRCAPHGGWFGPHRDVAVHLTRRVVWLRGVEAGRIAMQLKRFTVPGLPKVWRPEDFVTAFDRINMRQKRYSPGANQAAQSKADQAHLEHARTGAVRSPQALLKWYLEQLDPANDHPRFELDRPNEQIRSNWVGRREAVARENEHLAEIGMERGSQRRAEVRAERVAEARRLMGAPPVTSPRNRR